MSEEKNTEDQKEEWYVPTIYDEVTHADEETRQEWESGTKRFKGFFYLWNNKNKQSQNYCDANASH